MQTGTHSVSVEVENIGGIDHTEIDLSPGVTVLSGRNATNRTSFLRAVMAALGSDETGLKADADEGHVELSVGDETYTRRLARRNGTVETSGDTYLSRPEVATLFGFLLEDNEARRAVERGADLREIIMRPVDTDEIKRRIDRLRERQTEIDRELERLDELADERIELEEKRQQIEAEIEETEAKLSDKRAEVEAADGSVEQVRQENQELEELMSELQAARSRQRELQHKLETERASLESLREEQAELEAERDDLPEAPAGEIEEIDRRLQRLRGQKEQLGRTVSELQNVISFNEELLDDGDNEVVEALGDDGDVTDKLLDDDQTVSCWTCGSDVEVTEIKQTVETLRSLRQSKFEERSELEAEIDDLKSKQREYEQQQGRRDEVTGRLRRIEDEIADRETNVETITADREASEEEIEDLEAAVEELQSDTESQILEWHKEVNQHEFDLEQRRGERDDVDARIEETEERLDEREELEAEREQLRTEVEDLRTRVERTEKRAVEEFNTHMDNVLDVLSYANIERIWIERKEREVRDGRRKVTKSVFDLHLVRTSDSGTTYEDTVDHLSESEREVTGLVFALAGYLAHEVYEQVPFVLLDSLEAIDADRIADLVSYLEEYADNLVVALLPEDAAALPDDYHYVEDI